MSSTKQVFSDSAFTAVRSFVSILRGLAIIPLITNLLGAGTYGIWVTLIAALTLLTSTTGVHLHGALIRYGSQDLEENQVYADTMILTLVFAIITGLLVSGFGLVSNFTAILQESIPDYQILFAVFSLLLVMRMVLNININFPRSKGNSRYYDLLRIARNLLETLALVGIFLSGGGLIAGLAGLSFVAIILNIVIVSYIMLKYPIPSPNLSNTHKYLHYGIPMIPKEVSSSILQDIDKYLLLFFLGSSFVGVYSVAQKVCRPIVNLTEIFNPTLYPAITNAWREDDEEAIAEIYASIFRYYTLLGIPAVFGFLLVSESLMAVVSNSDIAEQGLALIPIFLFGYFMRGYGNPLRFILTSAERTDLIGGIVTLGVFLNIILNILFIPRIGMYGAAIATLAAQSLLFGLTFYYAFNMVPFPIPHTTVIRSFLSAIVMFGILWNLPLSLSPWQSLMIYPLSGVVLYFILILITGEISQSEREYIQNIFSS